MEAIQIKKQRFFSTGPAVVVACDHGEFDGPIPGMVDIRQTFSKINPEVDGVLLSPGMIRFSGQLFTQRAAPVVIGRLNWNTVYCFQWNYHQAVSSLAFCPAEALSLGTEMVLVSLTLKTGEEKQDARNVAIFRELTAESHRLGLPVMGEYFPAKSEQLSPEDKHQEVKTGCRILAELGADLIKTFFTERFQEVAAGCPVPILVLGASKLPNCLAALNLAAQAIREGARGVVFGRNALQVSDPFRFQS
ncbi:MAG: hypothetical protein NC911_08760, partial [Candidatus Omnitrophica bacterium]|nr:hypothetical protein [Candidatus Omnitrophota bacterium]